jgi:glucokinase
VSDSFIGIDVGGTKIASAILRDGEIAVQALQATDSKEPDALIEEILSSVEEIRTDATSAIGIGVPSVIDWEAGRARTSVNVPLTDVPIREVLGERTGLPVYEGDELVTRNLVMFTIGTGVGGGIVIDGRPYRGATGAAAELGHTLIGVDLGAAVPEPTKFPQPWSLECAAAGSALDRLAVAAARAHPSSYLGERAAAGDEITGVDAVEGAKAGDSAAKHAIELLGERLGIGIANAINTFDPEVVAIGGGVSIAGDLLLEPARRVAEQYVLPGVGTRTEIRLSSHGPEAGVLGAALLAKLESTGANGSERDG